MCIVTYALQIHFRIHVLSAFSMLINRIKSASEKSTTFHFGYQQDSVLAHYFEAYGQDPKTITGFYPLNQGHDALLARTSLIESAQKAWIFSTIFIAVTKPAS